MACVVCAAPSFDLGREFLGTPVCRKNRDHRVLPVSSSMSRRAALAAGSDPVDRSNDAGGREVTG